MKKNYLKQIGEKEKKKELVLPCKQALFRTRET